MKAIGLALLATASYGLLAPCVRAATGDVDASFGYQGLAHVDMNGPMTERVAGPLVQADGRIVVCGSGPASANASPVALYRFDADGSTDATFGDAGSVVIPSNDRFPRCEAIAQQSDGSIIVAATGISNDGMHDDETQVFRFGRDGAQDLSFGDSGVAHVNFITDGSWDFVTGIAVQADDAILVAAPLEFSFGAVRLDADGHADPTFAAGGRAVITFDDPTLSMIAGNSSIAIDSQGRIVMTGTVAASTSFIETFAAARLTSNGSPDASFGIGGLAIVDIGDHDAHASAATLDAGDHIIIAGAAGTPPTTTIFPNYNFAAVRLENDGTLDPSFATSGVAMVPIDLVVDGTDAALAMLMLENGNILLAGIAGTGTGSEACVLELDGSGAPVAGFGTGGVRVYDFVSDAQTDQSFTGIARDGIGYALTGSLVDSVSAELGFVAKLDGAPTPLGHSAHSRVGPRFLHATDVHAIAVDRRAPEASH